ncbi:MAG: murein biosynthesis integral membrane protein MurJ [Chloroflexi bacterium]|nr:murein biosynthesis integral membrane protein MurJ [Chloroflexota bacterium]
MTVEKPTRQTSRQIARSTAVVIVAFGAAKAISLLQTFIVARTFGVGSQWDAFVSANSIPELIFTLIAGGALAYAFIPVFGGFLARDDQAGAWRTASHVINTIFGASLLVSIVAFILAPWLVAHVTAPGFPPDQQAQTVQLMRILLLSTVIFSVSGICMGILQSFNRFLLPALAPIMYDLGILFGVIFLLRRFGIAGVAIGAVIGAALHFAVQVPGLIQVRAHWYPELGWRDPNLWRILRLMLPRIGGLGVFSFNFIVMGNIASRLGTGSVSALNWGWRLMQIPETLIGTAMGTVIFPTLAALSELNDNDGKRTAMSGALRFILIATIPSAVGLILIGQPLISLLEGGAFDSSASALVYSTLQFFTLGLVVHSLLEIIARSFYADKDTLTPFWAALGGAAINLVLSIVLSGVTTIHTSALPQYTSAHLALSRLYPYFYADQGHVAGLALANSLGVTFEVLTLLFILRWRWNGIGESAIARTLAKTLAASLVMGLALVIINTVWTVTGLAERGKVFTIAQVAVEVGVGGLAFAGTAFALKMDELQTLITTVLRRRTT